MTVKSLGIKVGVIQRPGDERAIIVGYLNRFGFTATGFEIGQFSQASDFDVLVVDASVFQRQASEFCLSVRQSSTAPIIMITPPRVVVVRFGINPYYTCGVHAWVAKPFSLRELELRIRRLNPDPSHTSKVGDVVLDRKKHEVRVRGQLVYLTPMEFDILELLMSEPGRTFTRPQILEIWNLPDCYARNIDAPVCRLRRKLEPNPKSPPQILSVWGHGYRFADRF